MRLWFLIALAGCDRSPPVATKPAPVVPVAASPPSPAPTTRAEVATAWPVLEAADIAGVLLAGPFDTLEDVCTARGKKLDHDCRVETSEVENGGALLEQGDVHTEEDIGASPPDHTQDRRRHLAIRTSAGWFATPWIDGVGGGRSSFAEESEPVDGHLVIRYALTNATSGKWAGSYEHGIVICKAGKAVACTPRIVIGRASYDTNTRDEPGGIETATVACDATFQAGTLTITPARAPVPGSDRGWMEPVYSADAAAACGKLPYAGAHVVTL